MNVYEALSLMIGFGILIATIMSKEALIKSLSAFILEFLCNVRNGTTRIASYLRSPMTKQCIKILIKADSMNESVPLRGRSRRQKGCISIGPKTRSACFPSRRRRGCMVL
ncbi:putative holin-like toxin [uncultured Dialister sp.]|uniref:putative holin-like toxin n=1 Tax=uncultured Dialister sp. TaxID=278064 RepID=UPI00344F3CE4